MRRFAGFAATLFAAVGCKSEEHFTDAGPDLDSTPTDATSGIDAGPDANPPGDVTVTTNSRNYDGYYAPVARPGVTVVAYQPDGTLADSDVSDASGNVTLTGVLPGASVSALYDDPADRDLVTVLGVKPGDHLVLGEHGGSNVDTSGAYSGSTVTFTNTVGTSITYGYSPCGQNYVYNDTVTSLPLDQYDGCQTDPADLLFLQTTTQPVRQILVRGQAFGDGAAIDISAAAWTAPDAMTFGVHGLIPAVTDLYLNATPVLNGHTTYWSYAYPAIDTGAASATLPVASGADGVVTYLEMYRSGNLGEQEHYQTHAASASSSTIDLDVQELPWIGSVTASAAAHVALWPQVGTEAYDGGFAAMYWSRYNPDGGEGGITEYSSWTIYMAPGATNFAWDAVPTEIAAFVPQDTDNVSFDLTLVDFSTVDGYDGLRNTPEWLVQCPSCAVERGDVTGDVRISYDGGEAGLARPHAPQRRISRPRLSPAAP